MPKASSLIQVKEKHANIIFETHSPDIIMQIFREIKEKNINKNDVNIYQIKRHESCSKAKILDFEYDGDDIDVYENWEKGISLD